MSDFDDLLAEAGISPAAAPRTQPPAPAREVRDTQPSAIAPSNSNEGRGLGESRTDKRTGVHPAWAALLAFLATLFFILWLSSFADLKPDVDPDVDPVDGAYVGIFYDDKAKTDYSESQRTFIDSAATAAYLDEHASGWVKLDVDDIGELDGIAPVYTEMAEMHMSRYPWLVIFNGKRRVSEPILDSESATKILQKELE